MSNPNHWLSESEDGDIDLYAAGGDREPNHLYQNQGDGTFVDVADEVGLALRHRGSGPTLAGIDGDDDLDLFVGAIDGGRVYLMRNDGGTFVDVTSASGLVIEADNTISATFGDGSKSDFTDDRVRLFMGQGDGPSAAGTRPSPLPTGVWGAAWPASMPSATAT